MLEMIQKKQLLSINTVLVHSVLVLVRELGLVDNFFLVRPVLVLVRPVLVLVRPVLVLVRFPKNYNFDSKLSSSTKGYKPVLAWARVLVVP